MKKTIWLCLPIIIVILALFLHSTPRRSKIPTSYVTHALGALDSKTYLNCKECFYNAYNKGARFFEADFLLSGDNKLVLMHDGFEEKYGLTKNFTRDDFLKSSFHGFTPLDLNALVVASWQKKQIGF